MAGEPFIKIRSRAVPLPVENVDTDQIIPARFLKAVSREGFGEKLFADWKTDSAGKPKADFPLNDSRFSGKVLVAGKNFGCGSSREHAAWSLYDYGFRVVISSFFADIFKGNALNNGILPIQVSDEFLESLLSGTEKNPEKELEIDLENEKLTDLETGRSESFEINPYKKMCIQKGYDDADYLISLHKEIAAYESERAF